MVDPAPLPPSSTAGSETAPAARGRRPLDGLRWFLITSGGLGCSPWAPGTVGTLGGVVLGVGLQAACPGHELLAWGIAALVLFVFGCSQSDYVARTWPKEDPGYFVLDEVVGYLVTILVYTLVRGAVPDALGHCGAFFAFRAFDVLKIQPARKLEDLPGAFGIMADDQMAGVYAGLCLWPAMVWLGH
ncbi:MAG: phosphatidylglycerophosphatase A [Planctomycetes bacterium]|nr:phosphatidylglycerophosphatase A [Planctomycetota bacterium]